MGGWNRCALGTRMIADVIPWPNLKFTPPDRWARDGVKRSDVLTLAISLNQLLEMIPACG